MMVKEGEKGQKEQTALKKNPSYFPMSPFMF